MIHCSTPNSHYQRSIVASLKVHSTIPHITRMVSVPNRLGLAEGLSATLQLSLSGWERIPSLLCGEWWNVPSMKQQLISDSGYYGWNNGSCKPAGQRHDFLGFYLPR